jgi:hypothetical protein
VDPKNKLRQTLEHAIEQINRDPHLVRSHTVDALAEQVGLKRRQGEPDNVLWARIEGSGRLDDLRKELMDKMNSLGNDEVRDFESALKNL